MTDDDFTEFLTFLETHINDLAAEIQSGDYSEEIRNELVKFGKFHDLITTLCSSKSTLAKLYSECYWQTATDYSNEDFDCATDNLKTFLNKIYSDWK